MTGYPCAGARGEWLALGHAQTPPLACVSRERDGRGMGLRPVQRLAPGTWGLATEARAEGLNPVRMTTRVVMRPGRGPAATG